MFQSKTCLGVDVSGKDIRVVELRKSRDRYEVVQAARLEVGSRNTAAALKRFLVETETDSSNIVWSLPTSSCSVKVAGLPFTKRSETARMVRYEAETQIPLPLSDLIWGFAAEKPAKGEDLSHVVIAGTQRSLVEENVSSLEAEGITVSSAVVASLAEVSGLREAVRSFNEPIFIINVGDEWTNLTAVSGSRVLSCRSVSVGIEELATAVAADHGIDLSEARELITQHGVLSGFDASKRVDEWVAKLSLEIRRSVLASMSGSQTAPAKAAILTGEGALAVGLAEVISSKANLPVEVGNPWSGMSLSKVVAHNIGEPPAAFSVATGLAISGLDGRNVVNLVSGDRAEVQIRRRKDMTLLSGLGITVIALVIILLAGYGSIRTKSEELDNLKIQTSAAKSVAKHAPSELNATVTTMQKLVKDMDSRTASPVEILRQLSIGLPQSCWLTEFRYEAGKTLTLRGNALSNSSVADAIYLLSSSEEFPSVSLDYSNLGKNTNQPVYEFQIKCELPETLSLGEKTRKGTKGKAVTR